MKFILTISFLFSVAFAQIKADGKTNETTALQVWFKAGGGVLPAGILFFGCQKPKVDKIQQEDNISISFGYCDCNGIIGEGGGSSFAYGYVNDDEKIISSGSGSFDSFNMGWGVFYSWDTLIQPNKK